MFKSVMHIAFYTDKMEEMLDFYVNKLNGKLKILSTYRVYLNLSESEDITREELRKTALKNPDKVFNAYIEIAPGQFIELFPSTENQKSHTGFNEYKGYSHFAVLCDDINQTYDQLVSKGIIPQTKPSKGPSETWQFWLQDPDGNEFEVMQYTENSYQIKGHIEQ